MEQTPCLNLSILDVCRPYCKWHKEIIMQNDKLERSEFMSIMKHSLPQRKLEMPPLKEVEYSLANKIFGFVENLSRHLNKSKTHRNLNTSEHRFKYEHK